MNKFTKAILFVFVAVSFLSIMFTEIHAQDTQEKPQPIPSTTPQVDENGYITSDYLVPYLHDKAAGETTTTRGYVDGKYIRLETRETPTGTVTTGWIDGEYVRIKSEEKK